MNLIDYAIKRIRNTIPTELLEMAFKPDNLWQRQDMINLDWMLRKDIIEGIIADDLNIAAGEQVTIPLDAVSPYPVEGAYVYEVPLNLTQGRYISRVISVGYGTGLSGTPSLEETILNATNRFESTQSSAVRLGGTPNTIILNEALMGTVTLKCVLGYDNNFSSINQAYWRDFATLATLATEMTIHKRLAISLASGSRNAGSPNSVMLDMVSEMADAKTRYQELLDTKWTKLGIMSDHEGRIDTYGLSLGAYD